MFSFFIKFILTLNFENLIDFAMNNDKSSLLLIGNLDMSYVKMKEIICHELVWNYNDIDFKIIWRCQINEQQYYFVPIMCDGSYKTMINSFIQSGLNMVILYLISQPKFVCVPISPGP